jgi:hypothetical protein
MFWCPRAEQRRRCAPWPDRQRLDRTASAWSGWGVAINYLFLVLLILSCVYAFTRGGVPERIGMASYAAGSVLTYLAVSAPPIRFKGVEVGVFIIDVCVFISFVLLALRANRYWPIWVSALQGLGILGSLAMLLHPRVIPWAYAVVLSIWSYPILLLVAIGTHCHQRRLKRNGADPSWTRFSAPAGPPTPPPGPTR